MTSLCKDAVDPQTNAASEDRVAPLQDTDAAEPLPEKTRTEEEDQGEADETGVKADNHLEKKVSASQCGTSDKTENVSFYRTRKGRVTKRKQPLDTEQPDAKCGKTKQQSNKTKS